MKFLPRRRRSAPTIIIISLIDILIVLLIFMMVTTTFKQQPAMKLALPESTQATPGSGEKNLVISIRKTAPYLYLDNKEVSPEQLQAELGTQAAQNPKISLAIRADNEAPFGQIVKVMDIAKAANIKAVNAYTRTPGQK